jgi:hypothetical protein
MGSAAGAGVIDDYVAELGGRLRGDRRAKLDLLTEARDSLEDAAECYRDAGFCDSEAERNAVHDFGPAPVIARDYQAELAAACSTRTLRSILFVLPVVQLFWEGARLMWAGPWNEWGSAPDWYYPFAQLHDSMTWAVTVAAGLALLVGRLMGRRIADSRLIARCTAGVALVSVVVSLLVLLVLVVATAVFDVHRLFMTPATVFAGFVSLAVMLKLLLMARRTAHFCV